MLTSLKITHLVLVEHCVIDFEKGLTIISGETGSGKTIIIQAISLGLGERADPSLIRKGEEKAIIEIAFDLPESHSIFKFLTESGVPIEPDDYLLIRREINRTGKSKAYINGTQVSLSFLQNLRKQLVTIIDQHSHSELREPEFGLNILDHFAEHTLLLETYSQEYVKEKQISKELDALHEQLTHQSKEHSRLESLLSEIEKYQLQSGEEETLTQEYRLLSQRHQLIDKVKNLSDTLSHSLVTSLSKLYTTSKALLMLDANLKEGEELLQQALIATQEASNFFNKTLSRLEQDPHRYRYVEERLSLIQSIAYKFHCSTSELYQKQEELKSRILELQTQEDKIHCLNEALLQTQNSTQIQCGALSESRTQAALILQKEITHILRQLNMNQCEFTIELKKKPRGPTGQDEVLFWLKANAGESPSLIEEHASGGELSRVLLALKRALAEKNQTLSLIFDEIDANVGGETASLIGKELKALAQSKQVFCITHFPQVAAAGDHHVRVQKDEVEGRTLATLEKLDTHNREKELLRMMGGKPTLNLTKQ